MNGEDLCEEFYANTLIPEILQNRGGGIDRIFLPLLPDHLRRGKHVGKLFRAPSGIM